MDDNGALETRVTALEKDAERNSTQHREFYDKFSGIAVKQGILDNTLSTLVSSVNDLRDDIKSLKDEPSKNYNAIKMCIATAIITAIVSGVISALITFLAK